MDKLNNKLLFALNTGEWLHEQYGLMRAWKYYGLAGYVVPADGVYNDKEEDTYVVQWTSSNEKFVRSICRAHNQECYMKVSPNGRVWFEYLYDGRVESRGTIQQVTYHEAAESSGYTELNNKCYVIQEA